MVNNTGGRASKWIWCNSIVIRWMWRAFAAEAVEMLPFLDSGTVPVPQPQRLTVRCPSRTALSFSLLFSFELTPVTDFWRSVQYLVKYCKVRVIWQLKASQSVPMSSHHQGPRPISLSSWNIFCWQLNVFYFVAPSLTRERVCNLLLLLGMASAVFLGPGPTGLMSIIFYCFIYREREWQREKRNLGW
jgi:hypothetical protein